MDAIKFCKERIRMCNSFVNCGECPLYGYVCYQIPIDAGGFVDAVEKWSEEHPIVTNYHKIKEVFGFEPNTLMLDNDWLEKEYKKPKGE